jgi:hypothetical protein
MTSTRTARWTLWSAWTLAVLFTLLPGSWRSPFSGIPLSTKAHLTFAVLLVIALGMALFRPAHAVRARWLLALAVLCAAKTVIFPVLRTEGWRGEYWTAQIVAPPRPEGTPLDRVHFFRRGVRDFRIDRLLEFNDVSFALFYANDWPQPNFVYVPVPRDVAQPLRVHWTGYVDAPSATTLSTVVSAAGVVSIDIDRSTAIHTTNPEGARVVRNVSAGLHRIDIVYVKAPGAKAAFTLAPLPLPVVPEAVTSSELRRARLGAYAIDLLGVIALLMLAGALLDAYRPVLRFILEDIWDSEDRVFLFAFVAVSLLAGLKTAINTRGMTLPLPLGDDPLSYEAGARVVLFNGLLMKAHSGDIQPYYFYPLYSYVLAGAHALFGEDYGTIRFVNWMCISATGVAFWALLRRRLTNGSTAFAMGAFAIFAWVFLARYAHTAFTDNLYVPICMVLVLSCANAFQRSSNTWLLFAGVMTALGGMTRPSLTLFPPVMILAVLLFWRASLIRRLFAVGAFLTGFIGGLAPFLVRNWIVSRRIVLMASMYVMLPFFLFAPGEYIPSFVFEHSGTPMEAIKTFWRVFSSAPGHFMLIELRKVLFTFGLMFVGPPSSYPYTLLLLPLLFGVAVWAKRIPRPILIAVSTFAISHLGAMVVAAPWTYGFKTILPFHLALLVGAAFLLPRHVDAVIRDVVVPRTLPPGRRSVSVVLPTYNEKDSIREVIGDFFATGVVDEVIVVNNNAAPGTSEEVAGTGAREVHERRQGYGAAIRRGLHEAAGDYIVICEPDGTFLARDIIKLLAYADDFEVVYGSRTSQELVWHGAKMGPFLRWGNWAVAKYMEFLFNSTSLTDVGCTMRLIRRDVAEALRGEFRVDGNQFGPEMMVLTLRHHYRVVQVPVNYLERVGVSAVTGDPQKAFFLGLQMIWLITKHRLADASTREPQPAIPAAEMK